MKNFISMVAIMLLPFLSNAQDQITKTNGDNITVKLLQFSPSAVMYSPQDGHNGSTELLQFSDIFAIRFETGIKVLFKNGQPNQEWASLNKMVTKLQPVASQALVTNTAVPVATQPQTTQPQVVYVQVPASLPAVTTSESYCEKGTADSKIYYTGAGSGAGGVGFLSAVNPLLGLITTAIVVNTKPIADNIKMPPTMGRNPEYAACYTNQAFVTKKAKVWKASAIGSLIFLGLVLIASSSGD
jgi:hypothetical protein